MDLIHLLKNAICIALIFLLSGIFHEIGHLVMCGILKCRIAEVKMFIWKINKHNGRWRVILDLKEKEHCSFYTSSKKKMLAIMLMGPINNLLLMIMFLFLVLIYRNYIWLCGFIFNSILAVNNLRPSTNNDGAMIYKAIKEIREERCL